MSSASLVWCEEPICSWVGDSRADFGPGPIARCPSCGSGWLGYENAAGDMVSPPCPPAELRHVGYDPADEDEDDEDEDEDEDEDLEDVFTFAPDRVDIRAPARAGPAELSLAVYACPDERVSSVPVPPPPVAPVAFYPRAEGTEAAWSVAELHAAPKTSWAIHVHAPEFWAWAGNFLAEEAISAAILVANAWLHGRELTQANQVRAATFARAVRVVVSARVLFCRDPGDATWH